ncbi:MAG: tRNA uridine-5-carboxymethylaminomethyl(34) synthesis GTPase MnmE [Pseudomonadota bacterium]
MLGKVLDNIVAEITPAGRGGISGIRISGPDAKIITERTFNFKAENRRALFVDSELDDVVIIYYEAPNSYTGENVCEVFCHGNPSIVNNIINVLLNIKGYKTRIAAPGEYTKRAYLNGRMDLVQAESVVDLINSSSSAAIKYRNRMLKGGLSKTLKALKTGLVNAAAELELEIDFEEEDHKINFNALGDIVGRTRDKVSELLDSFSRFEFLSKDLNVVIAGKANTGKSSLFNRLVECERAIVHHMPGTTRDYLDAELILDGLNITLIDTAGYRSETNSDVEERGIDKTESLIQEAALIIEVSEDDSFLLDKKEDVVRVRNKIDLRTPLKQEKDVIYVSALTGEGIKELKSSIFSHLKEQFNKVDERQDFYLLTKRQKGILLCVQTELNKLYDAVSKKQPIDAISFLTRRSIDLIDELLGSTKTGDEILDTLFSRFCIGK